jgi:O-antigen ligase
MEQVVAHLTWFVLAGALASAVIGWAQHIDSNALGAFMMPRSLDRVWGNLGQSNQLADYLALGLASAAWLYATARMRLRWAAPALLALVYILSLTGSRASWVYLLGLSALAALFFVSERTPVTRRLVVFCVCALVAMPVLTALVQVIPAGTSEEPIATASSRISAEVFAFEERPRIWKAAWMIFEQAPLLGVGLRSFAWHHFMVNVELPEPRVIGVTDHAHNIVLHVLAELGVAGLFILLVPAVMWTIGLLRQPRSAALWWICAGAGVIAVHSLLEYPLWYTFFLGAAALVLGIGDARTIKLSVFEQRSGVLVLIALLGIGWLVQVQIVRDYLFLENFQVYRYRYVHATPEVNRQAKELLLGVHRTSILAPYVEFGLSRAMSVERERVQDKLKINSRAVRLFPTDDMVYRQAMLLALSGEQAAAQRQWDRAAASFPQDEERIAQLLARRVNDGLTELTPLLDYARSRAHAARP